VSATVKRPVSTSPQIWPPRLERGRAAFQGEDSLHNTVGGPPEEKARRREGVGDPLTSVSVAWGDATATGPGVGKQPSEGCTDSAHGARNECKDDRGVTVDGGTVNEVPMESDFVDGGTVRRRAEDLLADGRGFHGADLPRAHVFPRAAAVRRHLRHPGGGDHEDLLRGGEVAGRALREDRGGPAAVVRRRITGKRKAEGAAPGPRKSAATVAYRCAPRREDSEACLEDVPDRSDQRPGGSAVRGDAASTPGQGFVHGEVQRVINVVPGGDQFSVCGGVHRIDEEQGVRGTVFYVGAYTTKATSSLREALHGALAATEAGVGDVPSGGDGGAALETAMSGEMNTVKCTFSSSTGGPTGGATVEGATDAAADDLASRVVS
jgi:hypothetical protein